MTAVDPDAVVRAVLARPHVARMSGGLVGEVACYLPGRQVPGVRMTDEELQVHIVAAWGPPLPEVADDVRAAVAPLSPGLPVSVFVDDVELPAEGAPSISPHVALASA